MKQFFLQSGQSLIELLLAIGLLSIILPALSLMIIATRNGRPQQNQRLLAISYLREGAEAIRVLRDSGWATVATDGTYHPTISGSTWTLSANSETIGDFTRKIDISSVSRDSSGAIVTSGGTLDPSTKKVLVTVSWSKPYTSSITQTMYLTRHEIIGYTETTQAQFDLGTKSNTFTTNTSGGEVSLGAGGGGGDWCVPSKAINQYDLPKNGVANALVATSGAAFAGQGNNASGIAFQRVNITSTDPPVPSDGGYLNAASPTKTNGIYADQQYAYITTDTSHGQVIILDMTQFTDPPTNKNFKQVGTIDLGTGSVKGVSVFTAGNYTYVTASNGKLYIYDVTNKAAPVLKNSGGFQIGTSSSTIGNKILVAGNYAYIATSSTTNPLRIINISNPANPITTGSLAPGTGQSGIDIYVNTTLTSPKRAYLVTSVAAGANDFYIVNIEDPANPKLKNSTGTNLGQYNTNGMTPTGLTLATGNKALIVGTGGTQQYQVVDISDDTKTLTSCAGLSYATGVYGVAAVLQSNGYAYAYIITGDSNNEFKIILGGAGGQYVSSGTYTSAPYDSGLSTAFNAFKATVSNPSNTTIKLQVAVANPPANGSCSTASYTFLGPGGDSGQFFTVGSDPTTIEGAIPLLTSGNYVNPGQCFKYRYTFETTDNTATPILYDMTVNYSP